MYTPRLSPRETEVLRQIVEGKQVKVIAHALSISSETVGHYIKRIYKGFDVHNRADVVRMALETPGLLTARRPEGRAKKSDVIGRENDIRRILKLLEQSGFVCIVGMGGIGKTRLAQLLMQELEAPHKAAKLIDLRNTTDGDGLLFQIARALNCDPNGDVLETVIHHAAHAKGTLILDNFEQLACEAACLNKIIEAAADLSVVVTSRIEIACESAVHYPLGGLDVDAAETEDPAPAITLFQKAARQVAPDIAFDDTTVRAVHRICRRLGGSPLAIKLASSWLDTLTMDQIADALDTGSDILAGRVADRSDHGNMDNVIQTTLGFRSSAERAVLARLSVFAGPFDTSAALTVAACSAATLAILSRAALIQTEPGGQSGYSLHPLLRETLRASFQTPPDHGETLDRFCAYYLAPLHEEAQAEIRPLDAYPCRGRNLLHAWDMSIRQRGFDAVVASAPALAEQMLLAGRGAEALAKFQACVKALAASDHPDPARFELDLRLALVPILMSARGHSAAETGENARRAVALARGQGDSGKLFRALWSAARFEMIRQDNGARIFSLASECHGVGTQNGHDQDHILSENLLGGAFFFVGDFVAAARHLCASAAMYDPDRHGHLRRMLGQDIGGLSHIQHSWTLFYLGRDADAQQAARRAEALTFRLGDDASHGWYLVNAACLHFLRGDFERVQALASAGLAFAKDAEIEQMISGLCLLEGGARIMLGDAEGGLSEVEQGMELRRKHGLGPVTSWVADLLCTCHVKLGNRDEAERFVRFGIDHAEASGCGPSHSELERHLGQMLEARGDNALAEAAYGRALKIADRQGARALCLRAISNQLSLCERIGRRDAAMVGLARRMAGDLKDVDTKEAVAARELAATFLRA